eukprot:TRINITY_DN9207_c0_g1_i1.p1 TRINITY_DN9207_c0_g1~~TRINITY_DN9207_c0_g1_i1.p1  ORF type:complete len:391 (+),score=72.02 TRINITY_DN9207_c0_g1_i1:328-1500(+)
MELQWVPYAKQPPKAAQSEQSDPHPAYLQQGECHTETAAVAVAEANAPAPIVIKPYEAKTRKPYNRYSPSLRESVLAYLQNGGTRAEATEIFNVPRSSIHSFKRIFAERDHCHNKKRGGDFSSKLTKEQNQEIASWFQEDPSLTLREASKRAAKEFGIEVSISTIGRRLTALYDSPDGISIPRKANDGNVLDLRKEYALWWVSVRTSDSKIFFMGEGRFDGVQTSSGGVRRRKKDFFSSPNSRSSTWVVAAFSKRGHLFYEKKDSPYDKTSYVEFLTRFFHDLQSKSIDHAMIISNHGLFQDSPQANDLIARSGHEMHHLPPHSLFLNPTESLFSAWKADLRIPTFALGNDLPERIDAAAQRMTPFLMESCYLKTNTYLSSCLLKQEVTE